MQSISQNISVLIIGGGLSGLHTAYELNKHGISFQLIEARQRLGGRILSKIPDTQNQNQPDAAFDLGPSWFWPHQTRIQSLLETLDLLPNVFEQSHSGSGLYEDHNGIIHRDFNGASMRGSYRIEGGIQRIISLLARQIPVDTYMTQATATEITFQQQTITTRVITNNNVHDVVSNFVVLALPPRLAAYSLRFMPQLCAKRKAQLKTIGTWMAGHAKAAVLYSKPFWYDQSLSGDAISQQGPLQEIHDASTPPGKAYGLIGFVSVSAQDRFDKYDELRSAIITQLIRLFGNAAASPIEILIKDWAFDPFTSTPDDRQQMLFHPSSTFDPIHESGWDSRLIWSGTETAAMGERNNGYLEGALEASERSINTLISTINPSARK